MKYQGFADAYKTEEEGNLYFGYRSDLVVYEEALIRGSLTVSYFNPSGFLPQTRTVRKTVRLDPATFHFPRAFELIANGESLNIGNEFIDFQTEEEELGLHAKLVLKNKYVPLKITVHTMLDGTGAIQRWLTLENLTAEKMPFARISVIGGGIFNADKAFRNGDAYELGRMVSGAGLREGDYHRMIMPDGEFCIQKTTNSDRWRMPFFTLENLQYGFFMLGQLGFSGEYRIRLLSEQYGNLRNISYRVDLCGDYARVLTLEAGEEFDTPSFHFTLVGGGLDDAVNRMNDHMRVIASPWKKSMIIEKATGPDSNMDLDFIVRSIDRGAELGAEVYYLDAAWYGEEHGEMVWSEHLGDWFPKKYRYPVPMREISDYVHRKGMKFGLWIEIERLNEKSEFYDTEIPPKLRNPDGSYWCQGGVNRHLDLSDPKGYEWAFNTISRMIEEYDMDFYRIDYNTYPRNASIGLSESPDLRYFANWYRMLRELQKKYPHIMIQNCAGGGARLDWGQVPLCANTQLTDQQTPPYTFPVLNGVSMLLPVEYFIQTFVAGYGHLRGSVNFQLDVCRFGNPQISWHVLPEGLKWTEGYDEKIRAALNTYRTLVRPNLPGCRVYHHTPEVSAEAPDSVGILEIGSKDRRFGMLGVFALTRPENPAISFRFRGLDASLRYRIIMDDKVVCEKDGYSLMYEGMEVRLETALDSRVVIASAIE